MIKGDNILNVGTPSGGGISIISNDPVTSGGGGGADSPPITDNLSIYFNPDFEVYSDAGTTLAADGDNIRQFNDQSGNSNTLLQTTASLQPTYNTTQFGNGNAAIETTNDWLLFTSNLGLNNSTSWTWYYVYEKTNTTATNLYNLSGPAGSSFRTDFAATYIAIKADTFSERNVSYNDDGSLKILAITVDRSSGDYKMYINGSYIGASPYSIANWPVTVGKIYRSYLYTSYQGVQMFYTAAHDATQVGEVSDWLNDKYQIY